MRKVAVIGLGNIAARHRRNLKILFPESELYAMSASGRVPSEKIENCDYIVASIEELIEKNIDLAVVASPSPFHAQHSLPLIKRGIPTLIEKPVTTSIDDADSILRAIEQYKTPVAVGYCLRYLPSTQKLKELFEDQVIGDLYNAHVEIGQYLPDWRPTKNYRDSVSANRNLGGGALLELSHELDYAQWLLGPLKLQHAVLRSSRELGLDVEDMVDILATTNVNAVVTIHLDFLQRKGYRHCSFVGSKGRIEWDLIQNEIMLTREEGISVLYCDPIWDKNKMYLAMIEDFVQMIQGNTHSCVELSEAVKTVSLINEIKQQHQASN